MQIDASCSFAAWQALIPFVVFIILFASPSFADDALSLSGRLDLRGVDALESDSVGEDPSLTGRIKLDATRSAWRVHFRLEGGWDGAVKRPARDGSLFKNYDQVYQSNTPYLEFKEAYLALSSGELDLRAGIQRYAWGRLDEFPPNDLLNPWDYSRFLLRPLEDRKIGVPSLSASLSKSAWTYEAVWVPRLVPYRLPLPDERWSGVPAASALTTVPNAYVNPDEPDLPPGTLANGNVGFRVSHTGESEWAIDLYHGYDPKPVFKTTTLTIGRQDGTTVIDPGYVPDYHRITSIGLDGATVLGDWSVRAEAAYVMNRYYDIRYELWGYPSVPSTGEHSLDPVETKCNVLDYGIGADYRLFEDGLLTIQAQQTLIPRRPDTLYERRVETVLWANLKAGWMNRKLETNLTYAHNPEHGDNMAKASAWWVFTDAWKAGLTGILLSGPSQSVFGRYAGNDEVDAELVYAW